MNMALVDVLHKVAAEQDATAGRIALAWLLAQRADLVPIPGTRRIRYLRENLAAADIELTAGERTVIAAAFQPSAVVGPRYPDMSDLNR